ncbi:MAG: AAA family ATPase [Clostridia bacterium]|nr:AAA family ATPase [Clostridia bacterium]
MNHISIEGMDGVGKSTTCNLLAEKLGYVFVEKPLHFLLDDGDEITQYQKVAKRVNANDNRNFTAWYYGLNNIYLYEKFKDQNIVTDRHIVSNYCWSGTEYNKDIYNLILKKIGKPKLTVILYATPDVILKRLKKRDINDADIAKVEKSEKAYERMIFFCETKKLNYIVIDTSDKTPEETVEIVLKKLGERK